MPYDDIVSLLQKALDSVGDTAKQNKDKAEDISQPASESKTEFQRSEADLR